jgi:hypothetical protein
MCGQVWGGSRILPYPCPERLRRRKHLQDSWAIPLREHKELQNEALNALSDENINLLELEPGDSFQPCYLDVPSKPTADFLWASLGSLVVSERVKNLLVDRCEDEVVCCNVSLRKIGAREAKLPAPIPSTGEPGDIIEQVPLMTSHLEIGPYFEICILNESDWPPGGKPKRICPGCKRHEINNSTREIRMTVNMWKGNHIFFLATTLHVIVTNDLKKRIQNLRPTNVIFSEI